jgi:NADPH2:quinone reductase
MEIAGVVEAHGPVANNAVCSLAEIGANIAPSPAANSKSLAEPNRQIAIGTRVAAFIGHGGLAEAAIVPTERLIVLPDAVDDAVGAAFQVAYGTSHLALDHKAKLRAGETLLVLGAAGGVGLTAVEIGKRMGAKVIAVARGADRLAVVQAAGADVLIDSSAPDLKAALRAAGGVDVVYDAVGGPDFMAALSATRPEGRLLTIGFAGGEVPQIPANLLLVKNIALHGFYYGAHAGWGLVDERAQRAPKVQALMDELFAWTVQGRLRFSRAPIWGGGAVTSRPARSASGSIRPNSAPRARTRSRSSPGPSSATTATTSLPS